MHDKLNSTLLAEGLDGQGKIIGKGETSVGPRSVFNWLIIFVTFSNVLVTCDTTYRTGLSDNNCGLQNFPAYSLNRARAFHIKQNQTKPVSTVHQEMCSTATLKRTHLCLSLSSPSSLVVRNYSEEAKER